MKLKRYIISFAHMEMLLRGEHHYEMVVGIPQDAKIISFKPFSGAIPAFDILVQSEEFPEIENADECKEYGSLSLKGMPCMPIEGQVISKQ